MIQNHLFPSFVFVFVFVYSLTRFTFCSSVNPKFEACNPATCGNQTIKYPFYIEGRHKSFCGYPGFGLSCSDNGVSILNISRTQFIVHEISYDTESIRVSEVAISSPNATSSSSCAIPRIHNTTLFEGTRFSFAPNQKDLFLLFGCNLELLPGDFLRYKIGCSAENETMSVLAMTEGGGGDFRSASETCNGGMVKTKIGNEGNGGIINGDVVRRGFELNWIVASCSLCERTKGKCGFDSNKSVYSFKCYCPDRDHALKCDPEDKSRVLKLGLGIGLGIGLPATLMIAWLIGRRCYRRKQGSDDDDQFEPRRNSYSADYSNSDPENCNIYLGLSLFSYKQLQGATHNFDPARVLGDGGFGIVYYGKLRDGREVAVKCLYEHNYRRVEQFRNEVKILTRLRHKNLVSLYGCTSRRSQDLLLVYEYISNGTVASHLQGNNSSSESTPSLPWPIRIKIAIETASALVYLHASDIIHRDVKTNNILVDNNFNVKVADFGLSRLFPNDVSHVSTAPQGTPGYVDPEYYQCYQLTSKSDVYSFGVVLIELISSKPAVDISRNKDEVNLSSLAMKKIQESAFMELVDPCLGVEKDGEVKRMVVSVAELAFQCLQRDKDLRPSMEEVLEALKRIQRGKGDDEVDQNLQGGEVLDCDNVMNPLAPLPPSQPSMSPGKEVVGLLKKAKPPPSSPNTVTDKWMSESSTPNASD